jgi:hypothetical protein
VELTDPVRPVIDARMPQRCEWSADCL